MWQSEADIISDLAILNDFGEPGNTEPYKVLCSVGRGSNAKKKSYSKTTLDPRTGEEIEIGNKCLSLEDMFCKGKGRGASLGSRSYSLLQKQLRLARPLGSGDEIIESYCRRNKRRDQIEDCTVSSMSKLNINDTKKCETSLSTAATIPDKIKPRIKAMRSSNGLNNALLSGLLKAQEFADAEKSKEMEKFEQINGIGKNNGMVKSTISQSDSNSEDSCSWSTNEDTTWMSLNNSPEGSDKVKLKYGAESRNASYCANIGGIPERNEICRRLGDKLNKMRMLENKTERNEISFSSKVQRLRNDFLGSGMDTADGEFVYNDLNFPPLLKNS